VPGVLAIAVAAAAGLGLAPSAPAARRRFSRRLAGAEDAGPGAAQTPPSKASWLARGPRPSCGRTDERYHLALRGCQDGLWEWDLGTDKVFLSPRWKGMLGFETNEIADDKAGWLGRGPPRRPQCAGGGARSHLSGPEATFDHEMRLLHKDGSVRNVLSRGVAIRRESGAPYRLVGLDTDVTRLKPGADGPRRGRRGDLGCLRPAVLPGHGAPLRPRARGRSRLHHRVRRRPATRVRTLAVWAANGPADNFEYALEGTPCAEVIGEGRMCFHREGLSERFPREVGWQAFLGCRSSPATGGCSATSHSFDSRPLGDDMLVDSIYRIFLARAAAEMERIQALRKLALSHSETSGSSNAA
jgi:PAS domain-containing protein